ncbi:hypothetical protein EZV62_008872 [Acer yangbiense]|uniref:Uncharacterized protein n=1 Tax=Acer yangbiense TaxID=1000413 RepID=A0A5C7IE56_9ROSI|nr:hypothetical protein EZV62_008872 [Acer yangbiense]
MIHLSSSIINTHQNDLYFIGFINRISRAFLLETSKVYCMDQVWFVVLYGKLIDSGGNYGHVKSRGVTLPRETSYKVLFETVRGIIGEDNPSKPCFQMEFNYVAPEAKPPIPPIEILNNDDVKFFLAENANVTTRSPLCINFTGHTSSIRPKQYHENQI